MKVEPPLDTAGAIGEGKAHGGYKILPFRTLADAMPNQVWTATPDGLLDWFNTQVYAFSGAGVGTLDGEGWASIVHPDDLMTAAARWEEAVATAKGYETEFRLRRADGAYRWHLARAVPILDANDRLMRWVGTNTDIHDQKLAAEALAESEARLRLAIEAGHLAVWELDLTTNGVTPSVALNRLYDFPDNAEPSVEELRSRYAPGEADRLDRLGAEIAARGGVELETEVKHILLGGEIRFYLVRAQVAPPKDGTGPRAIGVVIDVTAHRLTEEKLVQSERRLRLSQQAAGIASLELDIPTGNVMGSDNFWGLWGLSPRESVHISVLENIVIPDDKELRSNPETRRAGTAVPNVEYRIRRPDNGELRWLSRNIEFKYDEDGRPVTMFGVMQDITARKEADERQQVLTHELEHRIKNILATVSAIASQTLKNTDIDTARADFMERLRAPASTHDMLTKTSWTDASMREVIITTLSTLDQKQVVVVGSDIRLNAKAAMSLALAVNELGTNAAKYGALSTEDGRVEISWGPDPTAEAGSPEFLWTWRENGGPPVSQPARRGFGTFFIQRVLAADFGGSVQIEYLPTGIVCQLRAPLPAHSAAP
jgi:PAS domain S-box-containing protein